MSIVASAIIEWQRSVWVTPEGIWHPDYATVGLIAGVPGVKVLQKGAESKIGIKQTTQVQESMGIFGKGTVESEIKTEVQS